MRKTNENSIKFENIHLMQLPNLTWKSKINNQTDRFVGCRSPRVTIVSKRIEHFIYYSMIWFSRLFHSFETSATRPMPYDGPPSNRLPNKLRWNTDDEHITIRSLFARQVENDCPSKSNNRNGEREGERKEQEHVRLASETQTRGNPNENQQFICAMSINELFRKTLLASISKANLMEFFVKMTACLPYPIAYSWTAKCIINNRTILQIN